MLAGSAPTGETRKGQDSNHREPGKCYKDIWLHSEGEIESVEDSCRAEKVGDVHSV